MTDLQEEAKSIFLRTLESINISARLPDAVSISEEFLTINGDAIHLPAHSEILLIGFGKASLEMGRVMETLLGKRMTTGLLVANQKSRQALRSEVIVGGHPTPNENSLVAARKILELIQTSAKDALVIFLLSGGGSALVELPKKGISLEDLKSINRTLVNSGASIREINLVRKYLSQVKGGGLARALKGRRAIALYVSDVNPGDLASLASGPLIEEERDPQEVFRIIEAYQLAASLPESIRDLLKQIAVEKSETPLETIQSQISHLLLLDNTAAIAVAESMARQSGYRVEVVDDQIEGDYCEVAEALITRIQRLQQLFPTDAVCLLSGGEVSCKVKGKGIGGRNQEFVLYSAAKLSQQVIDSETAVLSCGTDGIDGISPATGAVAGDRTIKLARRLGLHEEEYIQNSDSHSFLKQVGGLLFVGPSGNNVRDIRVFLAKPKSI